ncbi:MAG: hypothetical protein RQ722_09080 [Desulfuromonadales bacterium]|nr:hypothetical protein [Desulfuromonadales bacterium]
MCQGLQPVAKRVRHVDETEDLVGAPDPQKQTLPLFPVRHRADGGDLQCSRGESRCLDGGVDLFEVEGLPLPGDQGGGTPGHVHRHFRHARHVFELLFHAEGAEGTGHPFHRDLRPRDFGLPGDRQDRERHQQDQNRHQGSSQHFGFSFFAPAPPRKRGLNLRDYVVPFAMPRAVLFQ